MATDTQQKISQQAEPIFVARQPIFTSEKEIWGYELLFRHSADASSAAIDSPDHTTARVIADGYMLAQNQIPAEKRMLINFPANLILQDAALALPKEQCIPEILETVEPTDEIIAACKRLKAEGYTLALDDYVGQEGFEAFLELADIIKVEVLGLNVLQLSKLTRQLQKHNSILLAEKIEDEQMFQACKSLGYTYFQGYYFSKPEIVPGKKISSGQLVKTRILAQLSGDFDVREMAKIIANDTSLSFRLLQYINSPGFGLHQTVESLDQALALLGQNPIRKWLMVVLLADLCPTQPAQEITFLSVLRGRFLELVNKEGLSGFHNDTMFLVGLFSRIDVLMGQPMEELIPQLPLDEEIKNAFLGEENRISSWLSLLAYLEQGKFDDAQTFLSSLGISVKDAAQSRIQATDWVSTIWGNSVDSGACSGSLL